MKIIAYAVRSDESAAFKKFSDELNIQVDTVSERLSLDTVEQAKGYDGVAFLGMCSVNEAVLKKLNEMGIKYIASRSTGYNNVDVKSLKALNMKLSNATYSPYCVADFTVMLILMAIRKMKSMIKRNDADDYSLAGIQGKEMHNLTFGIIGTGRIGAATADNLSGFNGKILGYDLYPNKELESKLTYVDLDTILKESDVISLHAPYLESTHHLLNKENLLKTKKGVVIINCARSELIDIDALIEMVENGHIGACGLDVFPNELGIIHTDNRLNIVNNHQLAILKQHKNVIVTGHSAFYTDQAVSDMVEVALRSLKSFIESDNSKWEIKL
ncbi:MAG: D-isomer specific 2-hydroxyacid dehydrogenase family protein [Anaerorhabdus sp.]